MGKGRRSALVLTALAAAALAGCERAPGPHAFNSHFKTPDGGPVALAGGPDAASGHGRAADAVVNGFELVDAAPAADAATQAEPEEVRAGPNGFDMVAAEPAGANAPAAMAVAADAPEAAADAPAAAAVALDGGPAAVVAAPAKAEAARPQAPLPRFAGTPPRGGRSAAPALPPLGGVPAKPGRGAGGVAAVALVSPAPAAPFLPSGDGAAMFAMCVLGAGALWRWHMACLKAAEPKPAPAPLLAAE
jgi:hypothetical protein